MTTTNRTTAGRAADEIVQRFLSGYDKTTALKEHISTVITTLLDAKDRDHPAFKDKTDFSQMIEYGEHRYKIHKRRLPAPNNQEVFEIEWQPFWQRTVNLPEGNPTSPAWISYGTQHADEAGAHHTAKRYLDAAVWPPSP